MSENKNVMFMDRLNRTLTAWKSLRPTKSFGGMSVDEFEMHLHKSAQARTQISENAKLYQLGLIQRATADKYSNTALQKVINAIKGDVHEGPEGELYKACGYIPLTERRRGLRANRKSATVEQQTGSSTAASGLSSVAAA